MRWNRIVAAAAFAMASSTWICPAGATIIYDNLSFPTTFSDSIRASTDGPLGNSFSTGANAFTLTDVKVKVELETRTPVAGASVTVGLYADSSTSPGSLISTIGTFLDTQLGARFEPVIMDFALAGIALDANTRYWIMLSTDNNSRAGWAAAGGDGSGSTYGESGGYGVGGAGEYFYVGGAISQGYPTNVFENGASPYLPYEMQLGGTVGAVPEPATWIMMMLGFGGLGFAYRRSRRNLSLA